MATNQVQARNPSSPHSNGLLSIPVSATKKQASIRTEAMSLRSTAPRPKMVVRRLPPGLTREEFESSMGEQWQVHAGKVDWAVYKPGKISKEYVLVSHFTSNKDR